MAVRNRRTSLCQRRPLSFFLLAPYCSLFLAAFYRIFVSEAEVELSSKALYRHYKEWSSQFPPAGK